MLGPDGEIGGVYRKIHMFDVDVGGDLVPRVRGGGPGDEVVGPERAVKVGLTVCYDLRFPELYRTGAAQAPRDHRARGLHPADGRGPLGGAAARPGDREPGLRLAPNQIGEALAALQELWPHDDRGPMGEGAGAGARRRRLRQRRPRLRRPGRDADAWSPRRQTAGPRAYRWPEAVGAS